MRMITMFPFLAGNVQELKQVVHDALVRSGGRMIRIPHLRFGSVREPGARPRIGLALGSGSVRGAAHVGVLKVLEEAGIPVDLIAGTSVGAFIGALYIGGQPISAFERVLPTVRWGQLVHPIFPPRAFVNNQRMIRFVEKFIGPVDFADLPKPFAAVAADAVTGEAVILNQGRVSHAVCASTAIPGFMEPVRHRNRLLVDGAVVHPVPVALARSMGADIVIAVDLRIPSPTKRVPKHFVASILNTIEIMSDKIVQEELQLADVVLNPHIDVNRITFKASPAFIQKGEEVTREALKAIKRRIVEAAGSASR
jgi:predicted acylesterase/phospholipase RssA